MKRLIILIICFLNSIMIFSQNRPDTFEIGDYMRVLDKDSILIYFNCTGSIVQKKCAAYFRKGKIDSTNINISGKFCDYYLDGKVALVAKMENDYLNGEATYFYENGNIKSKGEFKQDKKVGTWTYYYENGAKEKVINFIDDYPYIDEYYKKDGKQKVVNGNGNYEGEFYANRECVPYKIWGKVQNGKMEGKWTLYNFLSHMTIGYEYYKNGEFIKGVSGNYIYKDYPKIYINGFCVNENLQLANNNLLCPGDSKISILGYENQSLYDTFYPQLLNNLEKTLKKQNIQNQWLIVGLKINRNSKIASIHVKSSINDINTKNLVYNILNSNDYFTAAKANGENIDSDLYFSILIRNNQIMIPTEYLIRNGIIY